LVEVPRHSNICLVKEIAKSDNDLYNPYLTPSYPLRTPLLEKTICHT
jgi:hypothetical protein